MKTINFINKTLVQLNKAYQNLLKRYKYVKLSTLKTVRGFLQGFFIVEGLKKQKLL